MNDQNCPVEVTLNCSGSKDMTFSTKSAVIKKVDTVLLVEDRT